MSRQTSCKLVWYSCNRSVEISSCSSESIKLRSRCSSCRSLGQSPAAAAAGASREWKLNHDSNHWTPFTTLQLTRISPSLPDLRLRVDIWSNASANFCCQRTLSSELSMELNSVWKSWKMALSDNNSALLSIPFV